MTSHSIRPASRNDWPRITALMAQTPMSASLPLVVERSAAYDLAYPAFGGTSLGFVAECAGGLIGYLHARMERRALWDGRSLRPAPVVYVGDLRVAAGYRRVGVAHALGAALFEEVRARGVTVAFTLVNEGNVAALSVLQANPAFRVKVLRTFTTASRLLWRRPAMRTARLAPVDPEPMALVPLVTSWRERLFGPWIETEELTGFLSEHPEVTLFRRVEESAAAFALADPARSRRLLFRRLPAPFRALRAAWNGLRPVTDAPPFPGHGEAWRSVEVVLADRSRLAPELQADLLVEAYRRGAHALTVIESGLESRLPFRLSPPCYRLHTHLVAITTGDDLAPLPPELPAHVDLAFL